MWVRIRSRVVIFGLWHEISRLGKTDEGLWFNGGRVWFNYSLRELRLRVESNEGIDRSRRLLANVKVQRTHL